MARSIGPDLGRRDFLLTSLAGGATLLTGSEASFSAWLAQAPCADPFRGGRLLGTVRLQGRNARPIPVDTRLGVGLDARQFTDLSTLTPDRLTTPIGEFFVRTSYPDRLVAPEPWTITLSGLVDRPVALAIRDLEPLVRPMGERLLECAGNADPGTFGLMSAATWDGVSLASVLDRVTPLARATRVRIAGADEHSTTARTSTPDASWIFTFDDLARAGAFLATRMNGVPLPPDHGHPVRLVVPGWYACTAVKWVNAIQFLDDTAPATPQMREFASRTHQAGIPALAKDYRPALIDQAAMPIRVEQWQVDGAIVYRVVGIMWGGSTITTALSIRFGARQPYEPVTVCPVPSTNTTWSLWTHAWRPTAQGRHEIVLQVDDPAVLTRRLDLYYYTREVWIE